MMEGFLGQEENKEFSFFKQTQKNWKIKISKKIIENAKIVDYKDGVLTIKAKNPSWKNELLFHTEEIKKNFRQKKTK